MIYLDFIIQSFIVVMGAILFMVGLTREGSIELVLLAQLFLGPWQLLSAIYSIMFKTTYWKHRVLYVATSIIYLILIFLITGDPETHLSKQATNLLLIMPAWLLGLYYYFITWRITFPSTKKRSSFLPHLNF